MRITSILSEYFGFGEREKAEPSSTTIAVPPSRAGSHFGTGSETALTISSVYRAVQIITNAISQLSIFAMRADLPLEQTPPLLKTPNVDISRSAFLEETSMSLVTEGNCFWKIYRNSTDGKVLNLEVLPARQVHVGKDQQTGRIFFSFEGKKYDTTQIKHLKLMRVPGVARGLGAIQAAATEMWGLKELAAYSAKWISTNSMPEGILQTDQPFNAEGLKILQKEWNEKQGQQTRVLTNGTKFVPLMINPRDLQFLDTLKFRTTEVARLFGIPASLMLATVEGNSMTYANVEQDWLGFTRFTLMKYLKEIEEAFSSLLPNGQKAKFNVDALLRSDTTTRYRAHEIALNSGWKTINEVRADEDLQPLTDSQLPQMEEKNG